MSDFAEEGNLGVIKEKIWRINQEDKVMILLIKYGCTIKIGYFITAEQVDGSYYVNDMTPNEVAKNVLYWLLKEEDVGVAFFEMISKLAKRMERTEGRDKDEDGYGI